MSHAPLIEEDQAFLQRLQAPKRHCMFAAMVLREIRGHQWNNGAAPQTDPENILRTVILTLLNCEPDTDEGQWFRAVYDHRDEALRYVHWLLAWEQLAKKDKAAYRRERYQAWKRSMAPTSPTGACI